MIAALKFLAGVAGVVAFVGMVMAWVYGIGAAVVS